VNNSGRITAADSDAVRSTSVPNLNEPARRRYIMAQRRRLKPAPSLWLERFRAEWDRFA
jgi:hypothetical protein